MSFDSLKRIAAVFVGGLWMRNGLMLNYVVVSTAAAQRPTVGSMFIRIKCKTSVPSSQRTQSATIT